MLSEIMNEMLIELYKKQFHKKEEWIDQLMNLTDESKNET